MMTPRRTPVVAAEAGKLKWWTTSARAGCMLYLYGASGTTYLYIHLNNDQTLKNDNSGGCVASSTYTVADGAQVTAGQLIAWSGDSGDADGNPHLHFEVHPNDGADIDPYATLLSGERLLFPGRIGTRSNIGLRGNPTAVGGGTLTMAVTAVRWWPGGRWSPIASRLVRLRLATNAKVDESLAGQASSGDEQRVSKSLEPGAVHRLHDATEGDGGRAARRVRRARRGSRLTPGGALVALTPVDDTPTDTTDPGDTTTDDDPDVELPAAAVLAATPFSEQCLRERGALGESLLEERHDLGGGRARPEDRGDAERLQRNAILAPGSSHRRRRRRRQALSPRGARRSAARASCARPRESRARSHRHPPAAPSRRSAPVSGGDRCRSPPSRRLAMRER